MTCAEFDARLDDLLDGELTAADRAGMEAHRAGCPACAALHADLEALQARARLAPREVAPGPRVWDAVRGATLGRRTSLFAVRASPIRVRPQALAAAALALVVLSSAGTAWILREGSERRTANSEQRTLALAPSLAALEADYLRAASELARALDRDSSLSPDARAGLDRHLAVVDAAILEARVALRERPADSDLGGVLLAAHRQKLDLLERAARLLGAS